RAVREQLTTDQGAGAGAGAGNTGPITVWIRGGLYELDESFSLGPEDSGNDDYSRVTYSGYLDEEARLIGGRLLMSSSATTPADDIRARLSNTADLRYQSASARENVVVFDLTDSGISDYGELQQIGHGQPVEPAPLEVFVNNEPLRLARYPNEGSIPIGSIIDAGSVPRIRDYSNRGGTFEYTDDRHAAWEGVDNIWLQGTFMWGYADDMIPVESIDSATRQVKLAAPHMYGIGTGEPYRQYVALNILEELDSPGEYFLDRSSGLLYMWPPVSLDDAEVAVSTMRDPLVRLDEASFVTIRDLTIEYGRGMGVYIEGGESNEILGLTVRNLGNIGILMGKGARKTIPGITHDDYEGIPESGVIGSLLTHRYHNTAWNRNAGKNHAIVSCDVYNTGSGGIFIGGGDRRTLEPGGSLAENNRLWNNQRHNKFLWAGISVSGVGNRVAHNEIFGSDFQAIMVSGNEHVFEFNHVHHIGMDSDDTSPWYTGRDPSGRGHIVRYNYFHDIGRKDRMGMGVYMDDGTSGTQVYGNVFDKVASYGTVYSNAGSDNIIFNNIFLNGFGPALHIKSMWFTWAVGNIPGYWNAGGIFPTRLQEAVDITAPPYSELYPELTDFMDLMEDGQTYRGMIPSRNVFAQNLIVNYDEVVRLDHDTIEVEVADNWSTSSDPGFVDAANGNYALTDTAEVYNRIPGFERIPWESIGIYADEFRTRQ
ncbi:MAG: right-handed parallel beta-helix repeat-containing protein, partial [Rhodothermales bacterium]|nr:right-handed parallel beta-helix repeat-containing protein [Rhodothermales bacterium]